MTGRSEEIPRWVAELGSQSFEIRRNATRQLVTAAEAAVGPVAEAAAGDDLEVTIRAVQILTDIANSPNEAASEQAMAALSRLSQSENKAVARRAASAHAFATGRIERLLNSLGVKIDTVTDANGAPVMRLSLQAWNGRKLPEVVLHAAKKCSHIVLSGRRISDAHLEFLRHIPRLESVDVRYTGISDDGIKQLSRLSLLQTLYLSGTQATNRGLAHLTGLNKLATLYLSGTAITDDGAVSLKRLRELRLISLRDTSLSDAGIKHLTELTKLQDLSLNGCKSVTDAGVVHLRELPSLERLNLTGTSVSDAAVEHLRALTRLTRLHVSGTRISDAGVRQLKQSLPKCELK